MTMIGKVAMSNSLAKRVGSGIIGAEQARLEREAYEGGVLEMMNRFGTRLLFSEPEAPRDRIDMLERTTDGWFEEVAAITRGVDLNYGDPASRAPAAAKMIQSMIENPRQFAKSIFDLSFKSRVADGRAGSGGTVASANLTRKIDS